MFPQKMWDRHEIPYKQNTINNFLPSTFSCHGVIRFRINGGADSYYIMSEVLSIVQS